MVVVDVVVKWNLDVVISLPPVRILASALLKIAWRLYEYLFLSWRDSSYNKL